MLLNRSEMIIGGDKLEKELHSPGHGNLVNEETLVGQAYNA